MASEGRREGGRVQSIDIDTYLGIFKVVQKNKKKQKKGNKVENLNVTSYSTYTYLN